MKEYFNNKFMVIRVNGVHPMNYFCKTMDEAIKKRDEIINKGSENDYGVVILTISNVVAYDRSNKVWAKHTENIVMRRL